MTTELRVIELCTSEALGGLELYYVRCARFFYEDQTAQCTAFIRQQSSIHMALASHAVPHRTVKSANVLLQLFPLLRLIRTFRPHVIHSHHKTDLLLIALAKRLSGQRFSHVHTRQMDMPRSKKGLYHRWIYGTIDLFLTITDRLKQQAMERVPIPADRVHRLYYGVAKPAKAAADLIPGLATETRFKIGVIARIDRKKEQHLMIEAAQLLRQSGRDAAIYLIGGTTDAAYETLLREKINEAQLSDSVRLSGFVPDPANLMHHFDVVVLTTSNETFGLVLAEAMRAGVAVIGANGGGVPEIIEHEKTGLIFRAGDSQSLFEQLVKCMDQPMQTSSWAAAGQQKADRDFEESGHFTQLHTIFSQFQK